MLSDQGAYLRQQSCHRVCHFTQIAVVISSNTFICHQTRHVHLNN
jgi:hypothetical protein